VVLFLQKDSIKRFDKKKIVKRKKEEERTVVKRKNVI
jgi:hypothetical protein